MFISGTVKNLMSSCLMLTILMQPIEASKKHHTRRDDSTTVCRGVGVTAALTSAVVLAALVLNWNSLPKNPPSNFVNCTDVAPWVPHDRSDYLSAAMKSVCKAEKADPRFVQCGARQFNAEYSLLTKRITTDDAQLDTYLSSLPIISAQKVLRESYRLVPEGHMKRATTGQVLVTAGVSHCVVVAAVGKNGQSILAHINAENIQLADQCLQNETCASSSGFFQSFWRGLDEMVAPVVTLVSGSLPQLRYMECIIKETRPGMTVNGAWKRSWTNECIGCGAVRVAGEGVSIVVDHSRAMNSLRPIAKECLQAGKPCGQNNPCELAGDFATLAVPQDSE